MFLNRTHQSIICKQTGSLLKRHFELFVISLTLVKLAKCPSHLMTNGQTKRMYVYYMQSDIDEGVINNSLCL